MRLLLCDDHELFLGALAAALQRRGHRVVAATTEPAVALETAVEEELDCCVLDLALPGASGLDVAAAIHREDASLPVVILSAEWGVEAWSAYDLRTVQALVSKGCSLEVLERTVRRVVGGQRVVEGLTRMHPARPPVVEPLTDRERAVLLMLVDGASTQTMSESLSVSVNTVRAHVQSVMRKLGVHHRTKAVQRAVDLGLAG
jgi:DNA-binding NarL/FixJ family response regulator